jgi:hypothetical protein
LNKLNPEITGLILALGAITLFIFFFRTDEWRNKLSDLDKLILSVLVGYILWLFLIYPITLACYILSLYYNFEPYSFEDMMRLVSFAFILISTLLIVFVSPKNDNFRVIIGSIKSVIKYLIFFTPMIMILFYFSFLFSVYIDKSMGIAGAFLIIEFMWIIWCYTLEAINKDSSANHITLNDKNTRHIFGMFIIGMLFFSIIGGILGIYYNPNITKSTNLERIEISDLPINREYGYLPANFIYNTTFEIRFGLVKWVNIESNYTIIQAYDTDNKSKKYEWNGSSIFLRENHKANVTIFESKTQNISKKLSVLSKKDLNTSQEWNITLNNTNTVKIEIEALDFYNDDNLRLTRFSSDGVSMDGLANEINKSNAHFSIIHVTIEPGEKKSFTLYFTK